jgi:large subunit ribosomal protein L17
MFRNMVTSLFKYERIKTTDAKAKELRRWADHIVTLAKRGDLHARRMAMSILREKDVVHKVFEEAPGRFGSINGGYTRIVKIGRRAGDAAAMRLIELVSSDEVKATKKKKLKPATKTAAPSITPGPASDSDSDRQSKEKAEDAEATVETDDQDEPATKVKKTAEIEEAAVREDEESAGASAKEVGDQPASEK